MKQLNIFIISAFLLILPLSAKADEIIEIEDIWLTQGIHVTGDTLCQDGQFIYFKDQFNCKEASVDWDCQKDLKISPIHFIEKIVLPNSEAVTRFYNIKTTYDYLRYELTSFYPIKNYDLVESRQIEFPICSGMKKKSPAKIRKIRQAKQTEFDFISGLIKSGVSVLNTPYGSFSEMAVSILSKTKEDPNSFPKLKSPLCNNNSNFDDIVFKASGEWSGHGIVQIASLKEWQEQSMDLKVKVKKDQQHNKVFEFYCKNEGDNEP